MHCWHCTADCLYSNFDDREIGNWRELHSYWYYSLQNTIVSDKKICVSKQIENLSLLPVLLSMPLNELPLVYIANRIIHQVILQQRSSLIQNQFVRWKGHNKWGNIKATKGAKDLAFATLSSRYAMNISIAIKEHGNETNPERNKTLAKYVIILRGTTLSVLRIFVHSVSCPFSCQKFCNSNFSVKLQHTLLEFCHLTNFFPTWSWLLILIPIFS